MKLKRHINFVNEELKYYNEYTTMNGAGTDLYEDDNGLYYAKEHTVINFNNTDVTKGELVPELIPRLPNIIDASNIGLDTLRYFPKDYVENFNISDNDITDLIYCPSEIDGEFNCSNNKLTSLVGSPSKIHGEFDCSYNLLTDLENFPKYIEGDIILNYNESLKTLKGIEVIENCDYLTLEGCKNLTEIDYFPEEVRQLEISNTSIKSLRSLAGKNVFSIDRTDLISNFEIDFYFKDFNNSISKSYDQQLVDYLIHEHEEENIDTDELTEHILSIQLNLGDIIIPDKYKNLFGSVKTINKFSL